MSTGQTGRGQMSDSDLVFSTVTELGEALRKKQVSSVDLTTLYLNRLETLGPKLGALAYLTRPGALVQAAQADRERQSGKPRRAAARHSLRRQGPAGDGERPDRVGQPRPQRAGLRL